MSSTNVAQTWLVLLWHLKIKLMLNPPIGSILLQTVGASDVCKMMNMSRKSNSRFPRHDVFTSSVLLLTLLTTLGVHYNISFPLSAQRPFFLGCKIGGSEFDRMWKFFQSMQFLLHSMQFLLHSRCKIRFWEFAKVS